MSWECVKWAIDETRVRGPVYTVLLALAESAHAESGACRLTGARQIAAKAHIDDHKRVGAYLRELEALQLLRITRTSGKRSYYDLTGYTTWLTGGKIAPTTQPDAKSPPVSDTPGAKSPPHRGQNRPHTGGKIAPTLSPIPVSHRENTYAPVRTHVRPREEVHAASEFSRAREWARTADGQAYISRYKVNATLDGRLVRAWRNAQAATATATGGTAR